MLGRRRQAIRQNEESLQVKKRKWQLEQEKYVHSTVGALSSPNTVPSPCSSSKQSKDPVGNLANKSEPFVARRNEGGTDDAEKLDDLLEGASASSTGSDEVADDFAKDRIAKDESSQLKEQYVTAESNASANDTLNNDLKAEESETHESQSKDSSFTDTTKSDTAATSKRRRFEWMDSDDEDITDSSEEEDEAGETPEAPKVCEDATASAAPSGTDTAADSEKLNEAVRFAFISNISWEARLEDLGAWIEKQSKQKVLSITPEGANSALGRNSIAKPIAAPHKGRVYVEVESHQALLDVLRLNERHFMGRSVRVIRAYKRAGQFYLLQTPAHYRFFYQQQPLAPIVQRIVKSKQHKVDGGFNWAK